MWCVKQVLRIVSAMSILTTVTEAEAKVVDVVRDLQAPVVGYVQKGVDLAGERLPKVTYPSTLPKPGEVLDSQYEFVTALLAAQYDLVKAVTATVARRFGTAGMGRSVVVGTADELAEHFAKLGARGVERHYVWFADFAPPETLRAFAEVITPSA